MSARVRKLSPEERDSGNIREKLISVAYRIMASPKNANRDRIAAIRVLIDVALSEDSNAGEHVNKLYADLSKRMGEDEGG